MTQELTVAAEDQEIIETYLTYGDTKLTAQQLNTTPYEVTKVLNKQPVREYLTSLYMEAGFRNRDRIADVMDTIIDKKLEEMNEAEVSSSKDIVDILYTMHKIKMEEMQMVEKLNRQNVTQNNKQNNIYLGDNYKALMEKIVKEEN